MKLFLKTLILYFVLVYVGVSSLESRIIGGNVARSSQFPFIAAVDVETQNYRIFCGGAIVTEEWILTSGLCAYDTIRVTVSVGSNLRADEDPNRVTKAAARAVPHPDFNPDTLLNDIGLIQLEEALEWSVNIQAIKLATINLPNILRPTAVGWGQTEQGEVDYASELHFVELNILTNEACQETYGEQIVDTMVCLQGNNNEGTCYGDSGSPLVVRPLGASTLQQVGVSSFFSGNGCADATPSGFTRSYPFVEWVQNVTGAA